VQEVVESALDKFVGAGNHRAFQFSSRTDAGVHALRNTLHVDLRHRHQQCLGLLAPHAPRTVQRALNHFLAARDDDEGVGPRQRIGVVDVDKKPGTFHARFDAKSRAYVYRLIVRPKRIQRAAVQPGTVGTTTRAHGVDPAIDIIVDVDPGDDMCGRRSFNGVFTKDTAWLLAPPDGRLLDAAVMQAAAAELVGTHDFTSFRSAGCQAKSPVKTLDVLEVRERVLAMSPGANRSAVDQLLEDPALYCRKLEAGVSPERGGAVQEIVIVVKARSFMYNQVRNMVGFLVDIGQTHAVAAAAARETARSVLRSRDRGAAAYVKAPAEGLALVDVEY
jgi:tRNA pseudouridine38-40 synthase